MAVVHGILSWAGAEFMSLDTNRPFMKLAYPEVTQLECPYRHCYCYRKIIRKLFLSCMVSLDSYVFMGPTFGIMELDIYI